MEFRMSFNDLTEKYCANLNVTEVLHGKDGKSAYQIALKNGFVGTEEQWLESLKGEPGATYDDTEIKSRVTTLENRVTTLENTIGTLNDSLEEILNGN